jgi:hypothetical protein
MEMIPIQESDDIIDPNSLESEYPTFEDLKDLNMALTPFWVKKSILVMDEYEDCNTDYKEYMRGLELLIRSLTQIIYGKDPNVILKRFESMENNPGPDCFTYNRLLEYIKEENRLNKLKELGL